VLLLQAPPPIAAHLGLIGEWDLSYATASYNICSRVRATSLYSASIHQFRTL